MMATTTPCQRFAKQHRGGHGNECDRIDAHPAGPEIAHHRQEQSRGDRNRTDAPDPFRRIRESSGPDSAADGKRPSCHRHQRPSSCSFNICCKHA